MRAILWCTIVAVVAALAPVAGAAGAAHEASHPPEQPALLSIDLWTAITAVIVFLLLFALLSRFAWKPILQGLKTREDTIRRALDEAQEANERAKRLIADYEARIDHARAEAAAIAEEARRDGQEIRARIEAEGRLQSDQMVARAGVEIRQASARAWESLLRDAAAIATEAAARVVQRSLDSEAHAEIATEVVEDFARRRGSERGS